MLFSSLTLDNYEDKNDNDDGYIYDNDDVPDHNYRFEDRSHVGTGTGEGESLVLDGGYGGRIPDGECGTHNDGDDNNNIDKIYGLLPGRPHIATTGMILGRLADKPPPCICD